MFEIDVTDFQWIDGYDDDPLDLCLHGKVTAVIGNEHLEDYGTVSSTALYLLKTLTENHIAGEENQMIPCCGHFMIPNDDMTEVIISGCGIGIDWTVLHEEGGITIITASGTKTHVACEQYKKQVFSFADKVEAYYRSCAQKQITDDFTQRGYTAYWNEFHRRRNA